jgi:hypothetical protein
MIDMPYTKKASGRQTSGFALPEGPAKVECPEPRGDHFYMTRVLENGNVAARRIRCLAYIRARENDGKISEGLGS